MTDHGVDVDRIAAQAERLGLVSPDMQGPEEDAEADEIVVVLDIAGGNLQDVGVRRADLGKVKVVLMDWDNYEVGDEPGEYGLTALEDWSTDPDGCLARCKCELPDDLAAELGIPDPTPRPAEED